MAFDFTRAEESSLSEIAEKVRELREFLGKYELPADRSRLDGWFNFLNIAKAILGNFNNDISFAATLLAKLYLVKKHVGLTFDAAQKSQAAAGLDRRALGRRQADNWGSEDRRAISGKRLRVTATSCVFERLRPTLENRRRPNIFSWAPLGPSKWSCWGTEKSSKG